MAARGSKASATTGSRTTRPRDREMLLVGSKVKAAIKASGCYAASDALEGLNEWVTWLIDQAAARAKQNHRKTVRRVDFVGGPGVWPPDTR
jgi:hypothetical protein